MSCSIFFKPFMEFKNSRIIDVSTKSDYTYDVFFNKVLVISGELSSVKLPPKSIVVIYKINNPFDSILLFFACLKNNLIPFIVETEELTEISDLKYKAIITNGAIPTENIISITLSTIPNITVYNMNYENYYKGRKNDFIVVTSSKSTSVTSKKILLGAKETLFNINSNKKSLPILKNDRTLVLLPFSYSYGLIAQFLTHLFVGADIIIAPKMIGVIQLKSIIRDYSITNIFLTPLLARLILVYNNASIESNLRFVTLGGDKPCQSTISGISSLFNCRIYGTYGLAEAGPRVATAELNIENDRVDIGRINQGIEVAIVENEKYKKMTMLETIGYLKIYTPSIYLGYIQGNRLCKNDSSGFILTKDIVYYSDGKYYLLGRETEYIIIDSQLHWFQDFKSFFYNNPNILKVKIQKSPENKLMFTIFYKNGNGAKFDMEDSFSSYFGLKKGLDYSLKTIEYQYNQYK